MTGLNSKLVFSGRLKPGTNPHQAIEQLALKFRIEIDKARKIVTANRPVVIKSGLSYDSAEKYQVLLQSIGLDIKIDPPLSGNKLRKATTRQRPVINDQPNDNDNNHDSDNNNDNDLKLKLRQFIADLPLLTFKTSHYIAAVLVWAVAWIIGIFASSSGFFGSIVSLIGLLIMIVLIPYLAAWLSDSQLGKPIKFSGILFTSLSAAIGIAFIASDLLSLASHWRQESAQRSRLEYTQNLLIAFQGPIDGSSNTLPYFDQVIDQLNRADAVSNDNDKAFIQTVIDHMQAVKHEELNYKNAIKLFKNTKTINFRKWGRTQSANDEISIIQQYIDASRQYRDFSTNGETILKRAIDKHEIDDNLKKQFLSGYQSRNDTYLPQVIKITEIRMQYGRATLGIVKLFEKNMADWEYEATRGAVTFNSDSIYNRYIGMLEIMKDLEEQVAIVEKKYASTTP